MITYRGVISRGQTEPVQAKQAIQAVQAQQAAEEVKAATRRARQFAAPLLRIEVGYQAAVLAAHLSAVRAMRPTIEAGGSPADATRVAFNTLRPALIKLGKVWFPRALREGWVQGNARLTVAVNRRKKSWSDDVHLPSVEGVRAPLIGAVSATKAPRKPKPDVMTIFDLEWPEIAEYITTRPVAYAPIAAQTTVDMFRAHLVAGVEDGLGIESIVRNILGEQLPGISRFRATLIARTEVLSAGNAANFANYKASGVVTRKVWLSTRDAKTRETHKTEKWKRNRVIVPLNDPFVLPSGARLMFPLDDSLGAPLSEICRCRCSVGPDLSMPGIPDFVPGG